MSLKSATVYIKVQMSLQWNDLIPSKEDSIKILLGHMKLFCLLEGLVHTVFDYCYTKLHSHRAKYNEFLFLLSLSCAIFCHLNNIHLLWSKVVSHYKFDPHLLDTQWNWTFFIKLSIYIPSFKKLIFKYIDNFSWCPYLFFY